MITLKGVTVASGSSILVQAAAGSWGTRGSNGGTVIFTADSYLTTLADSGGISGATVTNITGNGHTVYYDASANPSLNGQTYTLSGGGYLKPAS